MSINIASRTLEPLRKNYAHIERRFGSEKPATRYQEAVMDMQPTENFHYAPTWETDKELFDASRTAIKMQDWYAFTDPRQYYYTSYVSARAKQQESMEKNIELIDKNGLLDLVPHELRQKIKEVMTPLRHVEYGANLNNQDICDRGYGVTITSLASFNGFDRIAISQYISRITLLIDGNEEAGLQQGREDWLNDDAWQGLRHAMEDIFVLDDWFEIMVAQNIVMDGLIYPLIYKTFVDEAVAAGATPLLMLTSLMGEYADENVRWTNKLVKVTAAESEENKKRLSNWVQLWSARLQKAIEPIAEKALQDDATGKLNTIAEALNARMVKQGLEV